MSSRRTLVGAGGYSYDEWRGALPMILSVEEKAELLQIAFNNHSRGRAVVNARMLQGLME